MKKHIFFSLAFSMLFALQLNAQTKHTGPAAKHCPAWKCRPANILVTVKNNEALTGPEAKNSKQLNNAGKKTAVILNAKEQLTGPNAKNPISPIRKTKQALVKN